MAHIGLARGLVATAAVVAGLGIVSGTSVAEPARPAGPTVLVLGVAEVPARAVTATGSVTVLTCGPVGGTHPHPVRACAALAEAGGDFDMLRGDGGACPMIEKPVTATAFGVYRGEPVGFHTTAANSCVLRWRTGPVFDF